MNTTSTETRITNKQIRQLRTEAASAGDHSQVLLCDLAVGDVVLDDDTTIDSLRIAAFLSASDRSRIAAMSVDDARLCCREAIESAQACA